MTDLPYTYTYTDVDGDRLAVFGADIPGKGKGVNLRTDVDGCSVPAEDAPGLARAVLAAAGDTGHAVMSAEEIGRMVEDSIAIGARSMQERAVAVAGEAPNHPHQWPAVAIRDLPLLPDGAEVAHSGGSQEPSETPSETPDFRAHLVSELLNATPADAAEELADDPTGTWERAYAAWTTHRADAAARTNTRYEERLDALEGLTRSIADLTEKHSIDISQAKAAIRGLARRPLTPDTDH